MNRDDITRMAREAGFVGFDGDNGSLRRFAALVAAAERDRCILILERLHEQVGDRHNYYAYAAKVLKGEV